MDLDRDVPRRHEVRDIRRAALSEQQLAGPEAHDLRPLGDELHGLGGEVRQEGMVRQQVAHRLVHETSTSATAPSLARMAAASSVMSMPTGHQAMQRPQPTQPDVSNWSHHVDSLWVSHWR